MGTHRSSPVPSAPGSGSRGAAPGRRAGRGAPAAGGVLPLLLLLCAVAPPACLAEDPKTTPGPRFAVVNQVHFHLEVVAGAVHVLQELTTEPVVVYLPEKVVKSNWYGFLSWMGNMEGVVWKDVDDYDKVTMYDLVWFITPEFPQVSKNLKLPDHIALLKGMIEQMKPKVLMYMVHNGHLPEESWQLVKSLASDEVPVLALAPHVAASMANRSLPLQPDWILPIYPFQPANPCTLEDVKGGRQCIRGFSVQGRIEQSRRNYTQVWEQIGGHRRHHTSSTVSNFRLNILGETVEKFSVPVEVRDLVAVYKNPPYPIFYGVVHHSFGLVPMLASELYYKSKFSSTVLTSLITGTPIIADQRMIDAYTMLEKKAVYYQETGQSELDTMFSVAKMHPDEVWRVRSEVQELRNRMNERAKKMIRGWLEKKGVAVESGDRRRRLQAAEWPLAAAAVERQQQGQQQQEQVRQRRWGPEEEGRQQRLGQEGQAQRWWGLDAAAARLGGALRQRLGALRPARR